MIGVRLHDVGNFDIDNIGSEVIKRDFTTIQLAFQKAIKGFKYKEGILNQGLIRRINKSLKDNGVSVAVLGCYIDPAAETQEKRDAELVKFKEHLRYARQLDAYVVGTETGHMKECFTREEQFKYLINFMQDALKVAESFGVFIALEAVSIDTINNEYMMKAALDILDSPNLVVIFDPVNMLDENNYKNQREIFTRVFEFYGNKIEIMHAKDFKMGEDGKLIKTLPAGTGDLDYKFILKKMLDYKPDIDILLENATEETFHSSKRYLEKIIEDY
ncbi:MAG: TIM barrel protein [Miniphocaeibacter sp.]|uniref:sugar phosphate isomerase/epimerase family protein n=1 Tax=Miniphocaeibacter sp. TaxID=3100973 RepID=UPI001813726F|nr:sugar phosphate isomerase/epimerase [Gallicola sp.]